jgi:hypothetical protein
MTRKIPPFTWLCPVFAITFFSCAASPKVKETPPSLPVIEAETAIETVIETIAEENPHIEPIVELIEIAEAKSGDLEAVVPFSLVPEGFTWGNQLPLNKKVPPAEAPVRPAKPEIPELIMGNGLISLEAMSSFLLAANSAAEKEFVENLVIFYIEEAAAEGINHDTAFAQMCLETGFLSFTGLVSPEQNNFCGLGSIGPGQPGEWFPDPRTGVRAHIQHLKAYATNKPLQQELVDPRYFFVSFGSSPAIRGLSGTWAADLLYADKIATILERLYNFAYGI